MAAIIYTLGSALILSYLFDLRVKQPERCMSFGLVRILLILPLLAGAYFYCSADMPPQLIAPLVFLENVFTLIWILTALRLQPALDPDSPRPLPRFLVLSGAVLVLATACYALFNSPSVEIVYDQLVYPRFGLLYISSFFMLIAAFLMVWRLEMYWRPLGPKDRRRLKYLVVAFFLISSSYFWWASYRLSYLRLFGYHFLLLALLLLSGWLLMSYAVARHRLLNGKLFVSRKVVYYAVAPTIFAGYLIVLGTASIIMRSFGWPLDVVLHRLLGVLGLLVVTAFALSGKMRRSVKYFISTNFYINKYEYRDEWLAFSDLLRGNLTESSVVEALRQILKQSLYTATIMIWLGDTTSGFRLVDGGNNKPSSSPHAGISADDPLMRYLQNAAYLDLKSPDKDPVLRDTIDEKKDFFDANGLVLLVPLTVGGQFVGFIGSGPELTGGRYGRDDYDLLKALCSQAASALLAARMAEVLAHDREKSAWNALSAFVLHDIKNAAAMLKLVKENARLHIHKPEFQQDLLALIDDALKRMTKVQTRLKTLKGEMVPAIQEIEIGQFLSDCCKSLTKKLPNLSIQLQNRRGMIARSDPLFIENILENLLLNALEAGGPGTGVQIRLEHGPQHNLDIEVIDTGPGIPAELLPDRLFEPFRTGKQNGSGIGLWQARQLARCLGGTITAENLEGNGAKFVVRLPIDSAPSK